MKDYSLRLFPVLGPLLLLAAGGVQAQPGAAPWYVTAIVGGVNQSSQTLDFHLGGTSASAEASYSAGLLAGAALGYGFGGAWRIEAEFTYQSTDLKGDPFAGTAGPAGNGNHAATTLALNLFREFDLVGSPKVRTYTGLGLVYLTENDIDFEAPGQPGRGFSGSGTGVQFLLGARYDLGERWFVDAGVRYLLGSTVEMDGEGATPGRVDARFRPWGLTAAVGWRF